MKKEGLVFFQPNLIALALSKKYAPSATTLTTISPPHTATCSNTQAAQAYLQSTYIGHSESNVSDLFSWKLHHIQRAQ